VAGALTHPEYFQVGGGIEAGSDVDLEVLQNSQKDEKVVEAFVKERSYKPIIENGTKSFEDKCIGVEKSVVLDNWRVARDPAELWRDIKKEMSSYGDFPSKAVSLTLSISDGNGKAIADLLPSFSYDSDRAIVTNLLVNVGGFCTGMFSSLKEKDDETIQKLVRTGHNENWDLNLMQQTLLPIDLGHILENMTFGADFRVNLYGNSLGFSGMNVLGRDPSFSNICQLSLGNNGLGEAGGAALVGAVSSHPSLETLHLNKNGLGSSAGIKLAELLKKNSKLTTLNVWDNLLGEEGGSALLQALKENSTLKTLSIGLNQLGLKACQALSDALKSNTSLCSLYLINNKLDETCGKTLADALASNRTLTSLLLLGNNFEKARPAIREAWEPRQHGLRGLWM